MSAGTRDLNVISNERPSPREEFYNPVGHLNARSVVIDPKCKPLFIVFIILGVIGLAISACGIAGIGTQCQWWSAGLINQLSQPYPMIFAIAGGISGMSFFVCGIVGVKIDKQKPIIEKTHHSLTTEPEHSQDVVQKPSTVAITATSPGKKQKTTNRQGQICITTQTGGYIGYPTDRQLLPPYLKEITLEDGFPLPLEPKDFFVQLHVFNMSAQLGKTGIPSTLYLPGMLFKDKQDNDVIRLKYKSKLIELTIQQQNHGLKYAKGTFQDMLALQAVYIKESCDPINPLFCIYDPYWFYRLGDKGVIYKLETDKCEKDITLSRLKEGTSADFRPKLDPATAPGDITLLEDQKILIFVIEFCRFQPQDFDIVLNETHIIIYGRFENRPLFDPPIDLNQADNTYEGDLDKWIKATSSGRETMFECRWDKMECFKEFNLEEMKTIMEKSSCLLFRGLLQLTIPLT